MRADDDCSVHRDRHHLKGSDPFNFTQVLAVVLRFKEDRLAVSPALDHVHWDVGQEVAWLAGHRVAGVQTTIAAYTGIAVG